MPLSDKTYIPLITGISIVVPVVVTVLLYVPALRIAGFDPYILPKVNAVINSMVSVLLIAGLAFIKAKNMRAHRLCMLSSIGLSALFLVSYVLYHASAEETRFGGQGIIRPIYFALLISHIVLAAGILPLVLFTAYRALKADYARHKKLARITFPLWLYVSVTGVVVYLLLSPYYPQ
jgi:putative membrane protein